MSEYRIDEQRQSVPQFQLPRRLKACVHCRELKLRCKRNEEQPEDGCERCINAGRQCIASDPVRKRRPKLPRKNVSSVASLESKLDALVAALEERRGINQERPPSDMAMEPELEPRFEDAKNGPPKSIQTARKITGRPRHPSNCDDKARKRILNAEHQYSYSFFLPKIPQADHVIQNDVISRGVLSLEEAERIFTRFTESMLPYFPAIVFPPGTKVSTLRGTKPALLLATLGAASNIMGESVQRELMAEVLKNYAERVVVKGDKDLDLVQAIQVSILWYFPPEHFNEVKLYQFIHMAATMAIELGFGQPARSRSSRLPVIKNARPDQLAPKDPLLNTSNRDEQRALLTCYILCSIAFMMTRRPTMMRWNSHIEDCVKALESPSEAPVHDLFLCQWVRAQHIAEEIGQQFFMDDPFANLDVSDLSVRYVLRSLEQQFDRFKANIPPQIQAISLQTEINVINLYLHEIFIHTGHTSNDFRPLVTDKNIPESRTDPKIRTSDPIHGRALAICNISVKNALNIFLSLDAETLCVVPVFTYARTAYVVFAMMKIYFSLNMGDGNVDAMLDDDGLDVEFYLDALLNSLDRVAQMKKLRVAAIFRLVLLMLKTWFRKQQRARNPSDTLALGMHRNDSLLQTVLETAEGIGADARGGHGQNSRMEDNSIVTANAATVNNGIPEPSRGDNLPLDVDRWTPNLEEEVPFWDGIDFASFLQDDSMLLQTALERLGGFMG